MKRPLDPQPTWRNGLQVCQADLARVLGGVAKNASDLAPVHRHGLRQGRLKPVWKGGGDQTHPVMQPGHSLQAP